MYYSSKASHRHMHEMKTILQPRSLDKTHLRIREGLLGMLVFECCRLVGGVLEMINRLPTVFRKATNVGQGLVRKETKDLNI